MADLTAKGRNEIKGKNFGLPETKQYPIEDTGHAKAALARASEELAKGNLTPAQAAEVRHKADHVLGVTDSTYHNK